MSSRSHYRTLITGRIDLTADSDDENSDKKSKSAMAVPVIDLTGIDEEQSARPAATKKRAAASSKPAASKSAADTSSETSSQIKKRLLDGVFSIKPEERAAEMARLEREGAVLDEMRREADNQNNASEHTSDDGLLELAETESLLKGDYYVKHKGLDLTGGRPKRYKVEKKQTEQQAEKIRAAAERRMESRFIKRERSGENAELWKTLKLPPPPPSSYNK